MEEDDLDAHNVDVDVGVDTVSHSSASVLTAYLKQFRDFQMNPPWEGSLEKHIHVTTQ